MSELVAICGTSNPHRRGDVVFVHGLNGDARATWQPERKPGRFWPSWLCEDNADIGVWSVGYEASSFGWKGSTMPLADRAINALILLESYEVGKEKPVIFITHSLGGLLVKEMLRKATDNSVPEGQQLAAHTRGVVFLSTPHSGSDLAKFVAYLKFLLPTVSVNELNAQEPRLRELNTWYRNNVSRLGIETQVYRESKPTKAGQGWFSKHFSAIVVDANSSDPGIAGVTADPVDEDHLTISCPERDSLLYKRISQFVSKLFSNTTTPKSNTPQIGSASSANKSTNQEELTPILLKRKSLSSEQVTFTLVLSGTIRSIDKAKVEGIVEHLRQLSGDMTMTLKKIESGSVRLILEGSQDGYQRLRALQMSGELAQILGQEVQKIELLIEDNQTFATWTVVRATNSPYPGAGSDLAELYKDSQLVETLQPGIVNRVLVVGYELKSGSYGVGILGSDQTIVRLGSNSQAYVDQNQKLNVMGQFIVVGPRQRGTYIPNIGVIEAGYTCKLRSAAVYISTNASLMAETYYALAGQIQIYNLSGANGQLLSDVFVNAGFKQTIQNVNGAHQVGAASPILSGDYTLIAQLLDGFQPRAGGQKILPSSPVTQANLPGHIA